MDDDSGLGIRNWMYYEQPLKNNLGLQLMSTMAAERVTKPLLSNGPFLQRDCGISEPSVPMEFVRDGWMHHRDRVMQVLPGSHHSSYAMISDAPGAHTLQMLQRPDGPDLSKEGKPPQLDEPCGRKDPPSKNRSQSRPGKVPKPKKPKKVPAPRDEANVGSVSRARAMRKNTDIVVNGIDLDLLRIPTPVCTCTGIPQQCYRWGIGGWQSACCTTTISMHPLPMSTKRRGSRIAGRKMSQGAFKKVLEKLAVEGCSLYTPIDLRTHWAKHGTNKFVTIR